MRRGRNRSSSRRHICSRRCSRITSVRSRLVGAAMEPIEQWSPAAHPNLAGHPPRLRAENQARARPSTSRETNNSASRGTDRSANGESSTNRGEPNRSEWKTFTPPAHSNGSESADRSGNGAESANRGSNGSYWNRTAPSSSYSRGSSSSYGSGSYGRGATSRPQLNMRQPIAQPRSSGSYGGYRGTPSYGGNSGGGSRAPSSSGGHASSGGGHSGGGGHR